MGTPAAGTEVRELERQLAVAKGNILALLRNIGDKGRCKGCGSPIYWVRHKNGRVGPYSENGLSHFIDCPKADQFRT